VNGFTRSREPQLAHSISVPSPGADNSDHSRHSKQPIAGLAFCFRAKNDRGFGRQEVTCNASGMG